MADKYCSYLRVSTKGQGDSGLGLDSQRQIIGYFYPKVEREFIEVKSGKNVTERPILAEAMDYCIKNDMVLVIAKVDRLTRSTKDGLDILDRLKGRIRFCDLPGEPDKFMLTLFFAFAERERELISIRTKGALQSAKGRGVGLGVSRPVGGRAPWMRDVSIRGAKARSDDSRNNENNVRAYVMAKELLESGKSYKVVVNVLNSSNFSTPSGEGVWSKGSVHRLIQRHGN